MNTNTARRRTPLVIVVTGTPGTGKTTVSKMLSRQMNADYLSLTRLVISNRLYAAVDRRRGTKVVDLEKTRAWLRESLSKNDRVTIVDTHVPDAIPREHVRIAIVLRCHPSLLERRLRRRGWRAVKVRENVLAEILDSCYVTATDYYGKEKIGQLDTSSGGVGKIVSQCKALLKEHLPGKLRVDWISLLEQNLVERYMS